MRKTSCDPNMTLGELLLLAASEDKPILEYLGIDSKGEAGRTLAEICQSHGLESHTTIRMLAAIFNARQHAQAACVELMSLTELCDHLEDAHRGLHDELKRLDRLTKAMAEEQAEQQPELRAIRNGFVVFQRWFKAHLRKESEYLFPILRRWNDSQNDPRRAHCEASLAQLEREHSQTDEALADLRGLMAGDSPSSSTQAALRTISGALVHLEHAVHEQIYVENRILFPRAEAVRRVARGESQSGKDAFPKRK